MRDVYRFSRDLDQVVICGVPGSQPGISIGTGDPGCFLPDDEIPNLISALQAYMSRRAREVTREAKGGS